MPYFRIGKVIVPSTACVWVMMVYLLAGTIMFAEWEGWNYLDSLYFCVTSLCKVLVTDTLD
jgi:potassium channel subfamily K protein